MTATDDLALIQSCQSGNLSDFDGLYTRYVNGVYGFIMYRVMDRMTAEDLTSQSFIKAIEHIGSYNPKKGAFSTWLYRIARNTVMDHFRTNRPTGDIEDAWDIPGDENPFLKTADKLEATQIRDALKKLSKDKREIVIMRMWDGLSYKEIAQLTGKSEAAAKMTFVRTVDALRTELSPAAFLLFCIVPASISL